MWEEVASGGLLDFQSGMKQYDELIPEGGRAKLRLNLRSPVSQGVVDTVQNALDAAGIPDVKVTKGSPVMNIFFKKGFPWLPVIVGVIIPLLIVLAIVIVSWQLYRDSPAAFSGAMILALGVVGAATFFGIRAFRRST